MCMRFLLISRCQNKNLLLFATSEKKRFFLDLFQVDAKYNDLKDRKEEENGNPKLNDVSVRFSEIAE